MNVLWKIAAYILSAILAYFSGQPSSNVPLNPQALLDQVFDNFQITADSPLSALLKAFILPLSSRARDTFDSAMAQVAVGELEEAIKIASKLATDAEWEELRKVIEKRSVQCLSEEVS